MALTTLRARTTAAIAAAGIATAGGAAAQGMSETPAPEAETQAQAQVTIDPVTDAEIDKFVAANEEVSDIAVAANVDLQAAEDKATAEAIQADAQAKMVAAIEEEGLTAERFTQIVQLAQANEELATKLRARMDG